MITFDPENDKRFEPNMRKLWILFIPVLLCLGCNRHEPRYVIGVSQCSEDIWREKQNAELRMGTYFHDSVELRFAAAYDSDERQVQQIDSLLRTGIDLLIVAPNQVQTISPAIDRAYDQGIPVIVFERKTNSKKYTAFISADNYEMGHVMGQYIASQLHGHGRVMEIMGLRGSSPAIERHKGFSEAIAQYPGIEIVATLQGDWTEQSAYKSPLLTSPLGEEQIDFVFAQNDRMAMGARRAIMERRGMSSSKRGTGEGLPKFCGIDGLPGPEGGIQLVRDSLLDASYIYPTHGDQLLDLAINILDGKPYQKEVMLKSALVTRDNANVLLMQGEEMLRQTAWLDQLHEKADNYMHELDSQRTMTLLLAIIVMLVSGTAAFVVISQRRRHLLERQAFSLVTNSRYVGAEYEGAKPESTQEAEGNPVAQPHEPHTPNQSITDVTPEEQADIETGADAHFLERLRNKVQEQMSESDFSVETLASQMGLSRVQLYRKVKTLTGRTPVDIIRLSRLNRSKVLLQTTDLTISEVAYQVGFTAPSYFTKCFKEEYGQLPGDVRGEK